MEDHLGAAQSVRARYRVPTVVLLALEEPQLMALSLPTLRVN
ncbi:hypothetical protein ACWD7F_01915 [Streptomyces sp. NPDC005122]